VYECSYRRGAISHQCTSEIVELEFFLYRLEQRGGLRDTPPPWK
jgi:hypothetical protein